MNKFKQATYGLLITTTVASATLVAMANHVVELRDDIRILQADIEHKTKLYEEATVELETTRNELLDARDEIKELIIRLAGPAVIARYDGDPAPLYDLPLSDELQEFTYNTCRYYGIEDHYELVLATMAHESNFNPNAVSSTNDYGLMQINSCNHEYIKETLGFSNIMDEKNNIESGIYILSEYLLEYDDPQQALMAYNMGPTNAREQWQRGNYSSAYSRAVLQKLELVSSLKK